MVGGLVAKFQAAMARSLQSLCRGTVGLRENSEALF